MARYVLVATVGAVVGLLALFLVSVLRYAHWGAMTSFEIASIKPQSWRIASDGWPTHITYDLAAREVPDQGSGQTSREPDPSPVSGGRDDSSIDPGLAMIWNTGVHLVFGLAAPNSVGERNQVIAQAVRLCIIRDLFEYGLPVALVSGILAMLVARHCEMEMTGRNVVSAKSSLRFPKGDQRETKVL